MGDADDHGWPGEGGYCDDGGGCDGAEGYKAGGEGVKMGRVRGEKQEHRLVFLQNCISRISGLQAET